MTVIDRDNIAASVRAAGGQDLDIAQALALDTYLRMAPDNAGPPSPQDWLRLPRPLREWALGQRDRLDAADWREIHGWPGDDA